MEGFNSVVLPTDDGSLQCRAEAGKEGQVQKRLLREAGQACLQEGLENSKNASTHLPLAKRQVIHSCLLGKHVILVILQAAGEMGSAQHDRTRWPTADT
jgi:hypothetical protein